MLRVGVIGAGGRMGREVCRAVDAAGDLVLGAAVDPQAAGVSVRDLVARGSSEMVVASTLDSLLEARVEVIVDFTVADAARRTLPWCAAHGIHAVVGTTGLVGEDLTSLKQDFDGVRANAVVASNFAIGAVLLMRFCEMAAPFMDGVEIVELHHENKRDAPSGTSLQTAQRIAESRRRSGAGPFTPDPTTQQVLAGARGAEGSDGIRIHSVRLKGLVAHEEVLFWALGQSLTIRHDSYDRTSFMPGVLMAVRKVPERPGLTVGLEPFLEL